MSESPKYGKAGNILAVITSIKPCCWIPALLASIGAGSSWAASWAPIASMILLPFVAWPSVLFTNIRLWKGLAWSLKNRGEAKWRQWWIQCVLTLISTGIFGYFVWKDYLLPKVFNASHAQVEKVPEHCPSCPPEK